MIHFDAAHRAVHYPTDRRFRIWIRPSVLIILILCVLIPLILAWGENALYGLPAMTIIPQLREGSMGGPHGFPGWTRWFHFFNFFLLAMLARSGLSILTSISISCPTSKTFETLCPFRPQLLFSSS